MIMNSRTLESQIESALDALAALEKQESKADPKMKTDPNVLKRRATAKRALLDMKPFVNQICCDEEQSCPDLAGYSQLGLKQP